MKTQEKTTKTARYGSRREQMPNFFFQLMTFLMRISDVLGKQSERNFKRLPIKAGQVVVDYGCGPARYIKKASETVGPNGKVLAVDIHPMAVKMAHEKIEQHQLQNVEVFQAKGYACAIPNNSVDVIYALDMFHMVEKPAELLAEFARMLKFQGYLIIEDGHQPRAKTLDKIHYSGLFAVCRQNKHHIICRFKETKCLPPV
ncbi:class I SAM-dependent methyltransferase [uncultured Draconibacterium sp.]|uniref:class I SAM-dependent methyltransferase n=1 Tax=uncultured Draconibacterium sp. TaxID=1573823 RepID=UPI00325FE5EE